MYIKYFVIITVSLFIMGCQSTPKGGAIPIKSAKEIKLDVLNIEFLFRKRSIISHLPN